MWLLGFELRTSQRAVNALNHWAISPAPVRPLYILQTYPVLHGSCFSWHHAASKPESAEVVRKYGMPPDGFWCISLHGVLTNAVQLCNIRPINTCMLLAKNRSSRVLSHACFSRTSFHLCLLQLNVPLCVAPAKQHPIDFPKNPCFHFNRYMECASACFTSSVDHL